MNKGENKIKLSIGILVSNQKQYIRKAMEALKPLLEAVPSELIVLDTKGVEGDGSINIVKEYTDKVYPFTWCNDFAKARNACLSYASGEWFMYQDDDEWFEDVHELICFFNSDECEKYNSGCYYTKSYDAIGGFSMGVASRIIRRTENTCFVGKIHETFNEFPAPCKFFESYVHHMGYVYTTAEMQKCKHERNMGLLREELEKEGYVPRVCAQMVQELMTNVETLNESIDFAEMVLKQFKKEGKIEESCVQWILASTIRCYVALKDYSGLLAQVKKVQSEYRRSRVAELVISAEVARYAYLEKDYALALEYVDSYLEQWEWLNSHAVETHLQMQLDFPSYYKDDYWLSMLYVGAYSANKMEDYQRAMKFWNLFPWKKEGFDAKKYWSEMIVTKEGLKKKKKESRELVKSDIKLTIGILVSNRVQYIRKTMESLKPLLEAIPSELIVVDTKGAEGDGSIDIVREYTNKIYPFAWCNDFAKARNVCMDNACGEWFMYLDDDEWFDDVQELIDFFTTGECESYMSAYYYVKNYDIIGNSEMAIVSRMIRRLENTHFVGKIHEGFNEMYDPTKEFQSFVHHMGYVYSTKEDKKAHQNRNIELLKEEIMENGYFPRMCAQMVQELLSIDSTAKEGFDFAKKSLEEIKKQDAMADCSSQWILCSVIRYSVVFESYEFAKEQLNILLKEYFLLQMAELAIAAVMILPARRTGNLEEELEHIKCYIKNWDWLQANPEEALKQSQLDFPKFYSIENYYEVLYEGALAENQRGNFKEAMAYWNRMPWKEEGFDGSRYFADFQVTHDGYKTMLEQMQAKKKNLQQEVEELITVLFETKPVISQCLIEERIQSKTELLAGMQEIAITLGNKLEALLGENTPQIRVLEHCCELLWQCANEKGKELAQTYVEEFFEAINNLFE